MPKKKLIQRGPFRFRGWQVFVTKMFYDNGRTALKLDDPNEGPIAVATVNLPYDELAPGFAHIKTWSENLGMVDWLVDNGIARDTGIDVPTGHCKARVVELLEPFDA